MCAVIGITGLPGAGKSFFSRELSRRFGVVIDADRIGHQLLEDPEVQTEITTRFGKDVLDGYLINRKRLAAVAFSTKENTDALNAITHPRLLQRMCELIRAPLSTGAFYVLDAALLFEAGFNRLCQISVLIDCDSDRRRARMLAARNWSAEELCRRDQAQDETLKRSHCDFVIDGNVDSKLLEESANRLEIALRYALSLAGNASFEPTVVRRATEVLFGGCI
ncbi:MAG: dephospho-CoA kinase [Planctomycetes bacterium]|nr:dephospho-CoA kinase [Planctomycetota bacterium]